MLVVGALYVPPVLMFPKLLHPTALCGQSAAPLRAGHPLLSAPVSRGGVGDREVPRTGHLGEGTCPSPPHTQAWAREERGKQLLDFVTFVVVAKSFLTHSA